MFSSGFHFNRNVNTNSTQNTDIPFQDYTTLNMINPEFLNIPYAETHLSNFSIADYHYLFDSFEARLLRNNCLGQDDLQKCQEILTDIKNTLNIVINKFPNAQRVQDISDKELRRKLYTFAYIIQIIINLLYVPKCEHCIIFHHYYFYPIIKLTWFQRMWNNLKNIFQYQRN